MVSMPAVVPVTIPIDDTVALLLVALQVPPVTLSVRVVLDPAQTDDAPVIAPALGSGLIVITFVVVALPQLLVTVYIMVSVPAIMPLTTPEPDTNALPFVVLHDPPVAEGVSVIEAPTQTADSPDMVVVAGAGLTAIDLVVVAVPQLLVTE